MKGHGFDGKLADHLREALRFLQPGAVYTVNVNTHEIAFVRRSDGALARFCVVCTDCKALVAFDVNVRAAVVQIEKHTEGNDRNEESPRTE